MVKLVFLVPYTVIAYKYAVSVEAKRKILFCVVPWHIVVTQ